MDGVNGWSVVVAGAAAFAAALVYYAVLGKQLTELSSAAAGDHRMPAWLGPVELVKHVVVAAVIAIVTAGGGASAWTYGVLTGLLLWIGFPVVLLVGSVLHEKVSWKLAGLHAGDWLVKLQIIAIVVTVWH